MDWRPAVADDAPLLADLATASSGSPVSPAEAETFLQSWSVELQRPELVAQAAVAVLRPPPGHRRGYGAFWSRRGPDAEVIARLVRLASSTPGLRVLQVTSEYPAEVAELRGQGFVEAFPVWTMTHDNNTTWTHALPAPLRGARWTEVASGLYTAYEQAYCDQRLVEPHTPETLNQLINDRAFAADLSSFAVLPDGRLAGFVLAFGNDRGGVELGPIGTVPAWRGRGVSSALLASTLTRCRDSRRAPITLTVDGESPTGAHRLYLHHGFQISSRLITYQLQLPGQP